MTSKILVVDDNQDMLTLLKLGLNAAGFCTAAAATGREALRKARTVSPDLILLDLIMPELDGFSICSALRKRPETARIPIILVSGLSGEVVAMAAEQTGAIDSHQKTAGVEKLVTKIKGVLKRRAKAVAALKLDAHGRCCETSEARKAI